MKYRAIPEFYDAENADKPMLEQDVPFLMQHLGPRRSILELAVGTGRAAIPLAQAGHRVVGIDNDPAMLKLARAKRDFVGLGDKSLQLLRQDMLKLDLRQKFDAVILLFNTFLVFTTLQQQDQALARMRQHLKPRGFLWIDIFIPHPQLIARPRKRGLDATLFHVSQLDTTVHRTTGLKPDIANGIQRVTFWYRWFEQGIQRRAHRSFDLAILFPREFRLLIERNGMRIDKLYGDYDGGPLHHGSPRLIALCRIG